MQVKENARVYTLHREQISKLVKDGPQKDAIALADVIFGTAMGASDRTFRQTSRPQFVISEEAPKDKEITSDILLAHYSPAVYLLFEDHRHLAPFILSTHQHLENSPAKKEQSALPPPFLPDR
jgi:hypothetical protein